MKILLLDDMAIRLEPEPGPLTIEAASPELGYSPFHMLASALATCTLSVLFAWAMHATLDTTGLALEVRWTMADEPHRVGEMTVSLHWPTLPPARREAAKRVAAQCTIHTTLEHPPILRIEAATAAT